jgi:alkanesulfonate monooxygenase SsuD/methylene tetrahydromethanopterin reductase-like flavin-dependent oxidoreductase (luciferase family)
MKFGLFCEWPNPATRDWKRVFEEGIEQIQYSEALGFDFVLIAEHHYSNYGMSPAPLMEALYVAERTKRLRIATGVLVLPHWPPLRLAEEVAVLDHLSDGRFTCGIGRGFQPYEFAGFGVAPEESRARFDESLDVLLKAWTSDEQFTYDGQYVKVPDPVAVWPKPVQQPHPPLWVAGSSDDTIRMAAERDIVPLTSSFLGIERIRAAAALWTRTRQESGKPVGGMQLGIQTMTHVADTDGEARENMRYARWQNRANRALNRRDVKDGRANAISYPGEANDEDFYKTLFYGSPETVASKYRVLAENGATFVSCWMSVGGMEQEKIMKSVRLMGEQIIPQLRDLEPPPGLAQDLLREPSAVAATRTDGPPPT